jgi:dimethylhistidine N-methyltransferase
VKVRKLLDHARGTVSYVPIDISRAHLLRSVRALAEAYPGIEVIPVCGDFTRPIELPRLGAGRKTVFFLGSTIGNFEPDDASIFLAGLAKRLGPDAGILIGVDLIKDPRILHAAYNDQRGVTAAFNLNLITRLNRELDAGLREESFRHEAFFNADSGRIEMHLRCLDSQTARIAGTPIHLRAGETIHTESSYKYTIEGFKRLAVSAGLSPSRVWTDRDGLFSVHYLRTP